MTPSAETVPWLPAPDQQLLLKACLAPGDGAREAWEDWRRNLAPDAVIDAGSRRLLPLAAQHLGARADTRDPWLRRGFDAWQRGRFDALIQARRVAAWVRSLRAVGVVPLLLKGFSLAQRYYREPALRPMDDVDFLVAPAQFPVVSEWLFQQGFRPTERLPAWVWPPVDGAINAARASVTHACGFVDAAGKQLDIHWSSLSTHCGENADTRFFERAVPFVFGDAEARALAPHDELFHTLAHGLRWNSVPSIRWVADAVTVVRRAESGVDRAIDWHVFVDEARRRGLAAPQVQSLEHLMIYGVALPSWVLDDLRKAVLRPLDRWRLAHALAPWDRPKTPVVQAFDLCRFLVDTPVMAWPGRVARYVRFRADPTRGRA